MAKKKENELTYLQMPLPQGKGYIRLPIVWNGINYRQELDTGELSFADNISTDEAPYLTPCAKPVRLSVLAGCTNNHGIYYPYYTDDASAAEATENIKKKKQPIGLFNVNGTLMVIYTGYTSINGIISNVTNFDIIAIDKANNAIKSITTGSFGEYYNQQHSVVQFNTYPDITSVIDSAYIPRILVFPECVSLETIIALDWALNNMGGGLRDGKEYDCDSSYNPWGFPSYSERNVKKYNGRTCRFVKGTSSASDPVYYYFKCSVYASNSENFLRWTYIASLADAPSEDTIVPQSIIGMPAIDYAAVFQSRLFGVGDGKIYASGYNDYANWQLDTTDDYNSSNAWMTTSQANVKSTGDFTGITSFQNHVIAFKKDFIHEVTNTKNPFRLVDVYSSGTIDNRSVQEVNGRLIFVSEGNVYTYTGTTPKDLGYKLGIDKFSYAVSGSDSRRYYLYCEDGENLDENGYGEGHFFVYDTYTGTWSERSLDWSGSSDIGIAEDSSDLIPQTRVISFTNSPEGMLALRQDGYIYIVSNTDNYEDTNWVIETDIISRINSSLSSTAYSNIDIKHIRKIQLLAELAEGAELRVYVLYDDEEFDKSASYCVYDSVKHGNKHGVNGRKKRAIRIKLRRSAHYGAKLHICGKGYVKLYELELFIESGGELYVET
ncbi:MAG: hypothetical protein ACI4EA_09395 [Candidatus Ornithomonoglobus sp.]